MSQLATPQQAPNVVSFPDVGSRPKLLDQVRHAIRTRHDSARTEGRDVAIRYEQIHETREVSVDRRPHVGRAVRTYMGDARG